MSHEENWINNLNEVIKYTDANNKLPSGSDDNNLIKSLGNWTSKQKSDYTKNDSLMKKQNFKKHWENFINSDKYKCYFTSNEENWNLKLNNVKEYIDKYNKLPSTKDKNKNIKILGAWISTQKETYNKNIAIMNNNIIKQNWKEFINSEKYKEYFLSQEEKWDIKLNEVIDYIDINKKKPSEYDINENVKSLGYWICDQQKNYKLLINNMKDKNIKDKWKNFANNYKIYLITHHKIWHDNLEILKKYIDDNHKTPSKRNIDKDVGHLGSWLSSQKMNYIKQSGTMKESEFCTIWEEFITEYQQYFPNNPAIQETKQAKKSTEEPKKKEVIITPPIEEIKPSLSIKVNRSEQDKLRQYLIQKKENKCVLCNTKKSVKLLETAHLKPHCDLVTKEKYDVNIVEFMCFECHKLYDDGDIGINKGILYIKDIVEYPQYEDVQNKKVECYNNMNKMYFEYHFTNIYSK